MDLGWITLLLAAGCIGGFLSGLLGVGGGLIFVPLITFFLKANNVDADDIVPYTLANSMAVVFAVGIAGSRKQLKSGNFYLRQIISVSIPAVILSLAVSYSIKYWHWLDHFVFSIFFIVLLLFVLSRMLIAGLSKKKAMEETSVLPPTKKFILPGIITGCLTAISGLGGGIIMVPYFNRALKLKMQISTSISLGVIPLLSFPLLIFYAVSEPLMTIPASTQTGYVIWNISIPMILGATLLSSTGVKVSQKLNSRTISMIFAFFIAATAIKMLIDAGVFKF